MSWAALLVSIVTTILLAAPFQWFMGAGKRTFIIREPSPGSAWGATSFVSGIMVVAWHGLFGGLRIDAGTLAGLALAAAAVALYEWARRTVGTQHLYIGLTPRTPAAVLEAGPYRHLRHPFYLSYILAFAAEAIAVRTRLCTGIAAANALLFLLMAVHDERVMAGGPLAAAYGDYRRRVGVMLMLPRRMAGA